MDRPMPPPQNNHLTSDTSWTVLDWGADSSTSPDDQPSEDKKQTRTLAPNLTRRSHKKSRNGCLSCKTRKIKCDETKPSCSQCQLKSVECQYPSQPVRRDVLSRRNGSSDPNQMLAASPAAARFTLNDMQFFHHFLTISFPHLPLGNDDVWVRDIPQFAQEHDYLMHAMLALGASHLNRMTPQPLYEKEALTHRGHAIKGLNTCMAKTGHVYGEADAMLATCYALTFQAAYMPDGLSDFVIFVRGCALATGKIRDENAPTAFDLTADRHHQLVRPRLQAMPTVHQQHLEQGVVALDEMKMYLSHPAERAFHTALRDVLLALQASSAAGYITFINVYRCWYDLDHDQFKVFFDSSNTTVQILLGFFIGVQMLMAPLIAHELPERATIGGRQSLMSIADWMDGVSNRVPAELQWHLSWTQGLLQTVIAELNGLPFEGPPVLFIEKIQEPVLVDYGDVQTL